MAEEENTGLTREVEELKKVTEDMAELLTNSVNMVDKYYEIFFDQNPHYVELEQYDKDGLLFKTLVPNRAMDRSVARSGDTDPEGLVEGSMGELYVNTVSRELYMKRTLEGKTGWVNITPQRVDTYTETYDVDSKTTSIDLHHAAYSKDYVDIYVNGKHLEEAEFDLSANNSSLNFYTQFPDFSTMQVKYSNGLYGLKGDTALTFKVGNTYTVDTDTPAEVKNVGTDEDIILDFSIPKGETGESGVWVGHEQPYEYLSEIKVWIDPSAEAYTDDELASARIYDSNVNKNANGYTKVYEIMHSTAEANKYDIKGKVTVDDEGIMRAYANGSGLVTPVRVKQLIGRDWSICGRDYLDHEMGSHQYLVDIGLQNGYDFVIFFRSSSKTVVVRDKQRRVNYDYFESSEMYDTYGRGWYNWKIERVGGDYRFYMSFGNDPLKLIYTGTHKDLDQPYEAFVRITSDIEGNYPQMAKDFTKFQIEVEGDVVYTPNRTEIDHAYDDNFIMVGSPVISEAGILGEVSDCEHYIYGGLTVGELKDTDWSVQGQFLHIGVDEVLWQFADPSHIESVPFEEDIYAGDYKLASTTIEGDKAKFYVRTGTPEKHSDQHTFEFDIEVGKEYFYRYSYDHRNFTYKFELSTDYNFYNAETQTYLANTVDRNLYIMNIHSSYNIVLGTSNVKGEAKNVYNDLNAFRINICEKLAYRPLLRIPVTVSKYGAKVVRMQYNRLVRDAYETHGIGKYYVIDEDMRLFILPLSDLYSLIEREYETRPTYGKGLEYNKHDNIVENLVEGFEIGDIIYTTGFDTSIGTRRLLNGELITITDEYQPFFHYAQKLREKGLVVSEAQWQAEALANPNGDCNKFVIDSTTVSNTVHYYAFIPDSMIIRTPVTNEEDTPVTPTPDEDIHHEIRHCKSCGAQLSQTQIVCTNCLTINEYEIGIDGAYIEGPNITEKDINDAQDGVDMSEGTTPETPEGGESGEGSEQPEIQYIETISPNLKESDIVYTTSLNALSEDTLFKKVDGIIMPYYGTTVAELLKPDQFRRHEVKDFDEEVTTETASSIRIPKMTSATAGYSYYIQIATGVKNVVNITNEYESCSPYSYGMYQYTDIHLDNPGWLLSEGQWNDSNLYISYAEWILQNIKAGKDRFKRFNDPNYVVTRYDYVLDEANHRFRLPISASASDVALKRYLIDKKEPSESDTTWYNLYSDGYCEQGGWFMTVGSATGSEQTKTITFPKPYKSQASYTLSLTSGIGNSGWQYANGACIGGLYPSYCTVYMATGTDSRALAWKTAGYVTESALVEGKSNHLYYYVGNVVQNAQLINVGKLVDEIASLKNLVQQLQDQWVPSSTFQELGVPASGQAITSPGNGWITFRRSATAANQWLYLMDKDTGLGQIQWLPANGNWAMVKMRVAEGTQVEIGYSAGTHTWLRFIPARRV